MKSGSGSGSRSSRYRRLEAHVVRMFLVEVVIWLWLQFCWELFKDGCQDIIDGLLLGCITVPDGNQVRIESNGEADSAELITYKL